MMEYVFGRVEGGVYWAQSLLVDGGRAVKPN